MMQLKIIVASTRPGRKGPLIASWIMDIARGHQEFETTLIDLAEVNLPFLDEPHHPREQKYQHPHTIAWSKVIQQADAFIIVTPEYNHGYPAPLKNALDFLFMEWNHKPVAFVSYGGIAGGTRAVQMLKQVVTAQKMVPLVESVNIPFFTKYIKNEKFEPEKDHQTSAGAMMKELTLWAGHLKPMRDESGE